MHVPLLHIIWYVDSDAGFFALVKWLFYLFSDLRSPPNIVFLCTCDGLSTAEGLGRQICQRFPSIAVYGYNAPLESKTVAGGHFSHFVDNWLALQVGCNRVVTLVSILLNQKKVSSSYATLYLIASSQESHQEKYSVLLNPNGLSQWIDEAKFEKQDLPLLRKNFQDVYMAEVRQRLPPFQKPHMIIDASLILHWADVEKNELIQWTRAEMAKQKPTPMDSAD